MAISFTSEDWARIREDYTKWWDKTLERPLIKVTLQKEYSCSAAVPFLAQRNCHRLDISAEDVVERIDLELEHQEYLGDAFPMINFDCFGPGIVAGFLGAAELDNSSGSVWFRKIHEQELSEMHFEFNRENIWLNRIKDIYRAGEKKWHGNVLMGMPDLGGVLDIVACLRGSGNLLYDLYDEPEEVKRVAGEIQELWLQYYKELEEVLQPVNPGYSDWSGLYSNNKSYVVQNDFVYMISPEMFREFAAEDLRKLCGFLEHTLYHMDGEGQLAHLPQLLAIGELDAIQWCPGAGAPRTMEWLEVYQEIKKSGKNQQILGDEADFRAIAGEIGAKGLYFNCPLYPQSRKKELLEFIQEYRC